MKGLHTGCLSLLLGERISVGGGGREGERRNEADREGGREREEWKGREHTQHSELDQTCCCGCNMRSNYSVFLIFI